MKQSLWARLTSRLRAAARNLARTEHLGRLARLVVFTVAGTPAVGAFVHGHGTFKAAAVGAAVGLLEVAYRSFRPAGLNVVMDSDMVQSIVHQAMSMIGLPAGQPAAPPPAPPAPGK